MIWDRAAAFMTTTAGVVPGWSFLTLLSSETEVSEELAVGQQLLQAAPQSLIDLLVRVVFCIVTFLNRLPRDQSDPEAGRKGPCAYGSRRTGGKVHRFLRRVILYAFLIFQIAMHLGINAATIATVLGSATVTVGLAFQGSLKNCIGGIMIMILHPFRVGDYIIESTYNSEGTVSEITVFYTKLATMDNKTIILPNGPAFGHRDHKCDQRRKQTGGAEVGISYEADIRKAKQVLEELLVQEERVRRELGYNIFVDELGDSAVVLGVRFWTKTEDYWPGPLEDAGRYQICL